MPRPGESSYVSQPVTLLSTSFGRIALRDTGGSGLPVLLLHGAGASSAVFSRQFGSPIAETRRLIAIDLPGHGGSQRPPFPDTQYTLAAVADLLVEILDALELGRVLLGGWSLGGHIALEAMSRFPDRLAGVLLCGAPPLAHGTLGALRAFQMHPALLLLAKPALTLRDAQSFARTCFADEAGPAHVESLLAADGRMRTALRRDLLRGGGADQRLVAETSPVPLAVVNGAADPLLRLAYLDTVAYRNLWEDRCHLVAGAGHAPFYTAPHAFNALLHRFAVDLDIRRPAAARPLNRRSA